MKQQRLKRIIGTGLVFLAACVLVVVLVRELIHQSEVLQEQLTALEQDRAQETQLARLKKLSAETAADRAALTAYYLQSQSDSIDFLNFVEQQASTKPITLETLSAGETERSGASALTVTYALTGARAELEQFIRLLETVPYASEVTAVRLVERSGLVWEATVSIQVIILETT